MVWAPPVTRDDLAEESDFLDTAGDQIAAFGDDVGDRAASLFAPSVGNDTEGAVLVAPLHDADERGHGFPGVAVEEVFADGGFAAFFEFDINNFVAAAGQQIIKIVGGSMEFLCADDEIDVREAVDEFLSTRLGHAAHKAEDDIRPVAPDFSGDIFHFSERLLLRQIPDTARIEEDHVGRRFSRCERVTLGHELGGNRFAVALVHLATVGFDIDAGHRGRRSVFSVQYSQWNCLSSGEVKQSSRGKIGQPKFCRAYDGKFRHSVFPCVT